MASISKILNGQTLSFKHGYSKSKMIDTTVSIKFMYENYETCKPWVPWCFWVDMSFPQTVQRGRKVLFFQAPYLEGVYMMPALPLQHTRLNTSKGVLLKNRGHSYGELAAAAVPSELDMGRTVSIWPGSTLTPRYPWDLALHSETQEAKEMPIHSYCF